MSSEPPLFVYGTLRAGQAPPSLAWLEGLAREPARASGRLLDLGAYPGWVPDPAGEVHGELVSIASGRWRALDDYEGYTPDDPAGSLFVREHALAAAADGERTCWIYRYNGPAGRFPFVAGGDWLARVRRDPSER